MCQVFTVHLGTVPTVVVADITILKELLARFVIVTNSPNHYRREANYLDLGRRPLLWHDPHLIKPLLIIENLVHIVWGDNIVFSPLFSPVFVQSLCSYCFQFLFALSLSISLTVSLISFLIV